MLRGLYTAWTGMVNEQKRLDVISNNMANADSVGYKDERVTSQAFDQVLSIKIRDGSQAYHNEAIGHLSLGAKIGEVYTDYTQGSIRQTHGTYDMALSGSGFFTVNVVDKAGNTRTCYTRNGQFTLTKDGLLVDSEGNAVQGEGGDIVIDPSSRNVSISRTGQVFADGQLIDTLKITDFEDYNYLSKYGDTMYEALSGATEKDATAEILQGYTEQSNVQVVKEMVDMITVTRAYEANQKIIHSYDSMLDRAVNQVGRLGS